MALNAKKRRFVDEYLIDLNATQAAIRAGYSAKTASSQGERLLRNVEVQALLTERMKAREKRTEITQDKVLAELAKIGFADIRKVVQWGNTEIRVNVTGGDGDSPPEKMIKVTASGKGAWLQSMRRTNDADIARIRGRSELVREAKK